MKKFYRLICVIAMLAIFCCCFAGCVGGDPTSVAENGDESTNNSTNNSTDNIVTNYTGCWLTRPDGKVLIGTIVAWTFVSENLIQVTLKDMRVAGTGESYNTGRSSTYLVSADQVWFYD